MSAESLSKPRSWGARRWSRDRIAWFATGILPLLSFLQLLHFVVVPHAFCEVHGDFVHAAHAEVASERRPEAGFGGQVQVPAADEGAHEACEGVMQRGAFGAAGVALVGWEKAPVWPLLAALPRVEVGAPWALYRLAPKQGPPRWAGMAAA